MLESNSPLVIVTEGSDATPLAWWYRHERGARIYDGADEVHKGSVARQILKRYGMRE